ncbi:MAG TPA: hypothetical protein VFZ89_05405, partial [Solirubrobacteraceae bacterium]
QEALLAVGARVEEVADPFAYATRVVQNLARRAYARARPETGLEDVVTVVDDVAAVAERRFELEEVLGMIRGVTRIVCELPPEDVDLVRAELRRDDQRALARRLGISRATFYRRKRDVLGGFVAAVARGADAEPCPDRVGALLAAAGGSGFASARRAREHAESCVACSTTLRHLTVARHGLAVLAPLPAAGRVSPGVGEWLQSVVVRGPDVSAVLPVSRGAAATIAATCVGLGGTTYCAVDGVPGPVREALGVAREPARSTPAPRRRSPPRVVARRVVAPARAAARPPVTTAAAPAPPPEFRPRKGRGGSAEAEFGSRSRPRAVAASAPQAPPPAPPPDPVAREFAGGGEFGR